jgi:parallel beta-helix repeat protein
MKLSASARVAALVLASVAGTAEARVIPVNCDLGQSINHRLLFAFPGDTLRVSGTCLEHVVIPQHKVELTIDGQGSARILAPVPVAERSAVIIRAHGTILRGFAVITGGRHGVSVQGGGHAVIDGNTIQDNPGDGINVSESSWAGVVNNTIRSNASDGVAINDNSSARIGFLDVQALAPSPNTFNDNGRAGVTLNRSSNARIAGNHFNNNQDFAVRLVRGAQADVAGNTMNGNIGGGIEVRQNSTLILTDAGDGPGAFISARNTGSNPGSGVFCREASFVRGVIAPLNGGSLSVDASCVASNTNPPPPGP